jgi:hypothetical protein
MSFRKNLNNKIDNIEKKIDELSPRIIEKARKYDEMVELLKNVKIEVKNASLFSDSMGNIGVKISYNVPDVKIYCDSEGNIEKDKRFYSMNSLDLISFSDMKKIQIKIDEAKTRNK